MKRFLYGVGFITLLVLVSFKVHSLVTVTASSSAGFAPFAVNFAGDIQVPGEATSYNWSIASPGKQSISMSQTGESTLAHTFNTPGDYVVSLTVNYIDSEDGSLKTDSGSVTVTAWIPEPLSAHIDMTADNGSTPPIVHLDSSESTGNIASYEWFVRKSGDTEDEVFNTANVAYETHGLGRYDVRLKLTDASDADGSDEDWNSFIVDELGIDMPPYANLSADVFQGAAPLTVNFTYFAEDDRSVEGMSFSVRKDTGNGNPDPPILVQDVSGAIPYTFNSAGTYRVMFMAEDGNNQSDWIEVVITVE